MRLTKSSAACEENPGFDVAVPLMAADTFSGDADLTRVTVESFFSLWSRKGFRDTGRSGAVDGMLKPLFTGDGRLFAGDVARLRNGLLEGRVSPADTGDCCL